MNKIINATPFIYLAKLGKLNLIRQLYPRIVTTPEVRDEVLNREEPEYDVLFDALQSWLKVEEVKNSKMLEQLQKSHNIHAGEASMIILANEKKKEALLFIDDKSARAVAKSFGFEVSGTLGIIIDATLNSLITKSQALQLIDQLAENTPFRMSLKLYKLVTEKIKEI